MSDNELAILKYAVTQGGLFLLLVGVIWSYRRDFLRRDERERERNDQLVTLVEKSTAAATKQEATTARLARAIEARRLVPREDEDAA